MGKLLKIERLGDEMAVIIPLDVQHELQVGPGDRVWVEKSADENASSGDLERQVTAARLVMKRRRAALAELAK